MNYRMIAFILGRVLLILAALMLLPLIAALVYGESVLPFVVTILLTALCCSSGRTPARSTRGRAFPAWAFRGWRCRCSARCPL